MRYLKASLAAALAFVAAAGWLSVVMLACGDDIAPKKDLPFDTRCEFIAWAASDDRLEQRLVAACATASAELGVDISPELEGYRWESGTIGDTRILPSGVVRVGHDISHRRLTRFVAEAWHIAD